MRYVTPGDSQTGTEEYVAICFLGTWGKKHQQPKGRDYMSLSSNKLS